MQLAIDGNFCAEPIQQCRLCLQVATLADVTQTDGQKLETWVYSRSKERRGSILKWPGQGKSSKVTWNKWVEFLDSLLVTPGP